MSEPSKLLTRSGLGRPHSSSEEIKRHSEKADGARKLIREKLADVAIKLLLMPTNKPWGDLSPAITEAVKQSRVAFGDEPTSTALKGMGLQQFDT